MGVVVLDLDQGEALGTCALPRELGREIFGVAVRDQRHRRVIEQRGV